MAQTFCASLALHLVTFVRTSINQAKEFKTILKMAEKTKFCLWICDKNWTEFCQKYKEMSKTTAKVPESPENTWDTKITKTFSYITDIALEEALTRATASCAETKIGWREE